MEGQALVLHMAAITLGLTGIKWALEAVSAMLDRKYPLAAFHAVATLGIAHMAIGVWSAA